MDSTAGQVLAPLGQGELSALSQFGKSGGARRQPSETTHVIYDRPRNSHAGRRSPGLVARRSSGVLRRSVRREQKINRVLAKVSYYARRGDQHCWFATTSNRMLRPPPEPPQTPTRSLAHRDPAYRILGCRHLNCIIVRAGPYPQERRKLLCRCDERRRRAGKKAISSSWSDGLRREKRPR